MSYEALDVLSRESVGTGGGGEEKPEKDSRKAKAWDGATGSRPAGGCTDPIQYEVSLESSSPSYPGCQACSSWCCPQKMGLERERLSPGKGNAVGGPSAGTGMSKVHPGEGMAPRSCGV